MTRIELEIFDDVSTALQKVLEINDQGIDIVIPQGSVLFDNVINLKLLKKHAEKNGCTVHLETVDEIGASMIETLDEIPGSAAITEFNDSAPRPPAPTQKKRLKFNIKFKLPKIPKAPVLGVLVAAIIMLVAIWDKNRLTANARIIVKSQALARSLTVKIKANTQTSPDQKTLNGIVIRSSMQETKEFNATGEKIEGEKAEGTIKIFNKTDTDKTFKKGQLVTYTDDDDRDFEFTTNKEVTVGAATEDNTDPLNPIVVCGETEVDVTASQIGDAYNIDKNKVVSLKGYKKSEFSAVTTKDFSGGKSQKVTVVSQTDITKAAAQLSADMTKQAESSFSNKISSTQQVVEGSVVAKVKSQSTDKKVGDTATKFNLTLSVETEGLTYLKGDLDRFVESLVKDYIPEGYVLSEKEKQISVAPLGTTASSILSSTEADMQVTLKAFVTPDINEEKLKEQLKGKTPSEAEKILGSIQNVTTYEFKMSRPVFPFWNKIPNDITKINVSIERE